MEALKYRIIHTKEQYFDYCNSLEHLVEKGGNEDEIDLLTLLIHTWDEAQRSHTQLDPVMLLRSLMADHQLKSKDLAGILGVGKSLISDILNYKKGFSKDIIRALAVHFKVSQEAFNRPYKLRSPLNAHLRNASVMNTTKELAATH
ncbi:type II toxin-antitoxin system HigA family antitoxin [Mucilaginibacter sp. AW1-3]